MKSKSLSSSLKVIGASLTKPAATTLGWLFNEWLQAKMWNSDWVKDKLEKAELQRRFIEKLGQVSDEDLIKPNPKLGFPLIEEILLRDESDPVQKIAQTLLAMSFSSKLENSLHPAIVQLLSDMAAGEAEILSLWVDNNDHYRAYRYRDGSGVFLYLKNQVKVFEMILTAFLGEDLLEFVKNNEVKIIEKEVKKKKYNKNFINMFQRVNTGRSDQDKLIFKNEVDSSYGKSRITKIIGRKYNHSSSCA